MNFNKGTLTLDDNLFINENYTFVDEIISKVTKCEKLVINGTTNAFHADFRGSSLFKEFWIKLGESVATLELNELPPVSYKKYLPYLRNVQYLSIGPPGIYQDILKIFHENKFSLKEICLTDVFVNTIWTEGGKLLGNDAPQFNNTVELGETLKLFKSTLKCLTIGCSIQFEKVIVDKVFSDLNALVWQANEVVINCKPKMPKESMKWKIEKVKLNVVITKGDITKLFVQPLSVGDIERHDFKCGSKKCSKNHFIYKSDSVKTFNVQKIFHCEKNYRRLFESFPFIVKLHNIPISDELTWHLISKYLIHLNDLKIRTWSEDVNISAKTLPTVNKFAIFSTKITKDQFKEFIKSVPNVKDLSVQISFERNIEIVDYDDLVVTITENLKKLEILSFNVTSAQNGLSSRNLDLIGFKLKKLKELHTKCFESFSDIEKLFNEYQHWEVFDYGYSYLERNIKNLSKTQITDLPPEMIEKIFLYLKINERQTCRLVCKQWLNIQALSPIINYDLDFTKIYLSFGMDPVKVLAKTTFPFHKILFNNTVFAKDEKLTAFWEAIGRDIHEICIQTLNFDMFGAVKSGFKARHFPKLRKITMKVRLFYKLIHENITEWKILLKQVDHLSVYHFCGNVECYDVKFTMSNVTQLTIEGFTNEITDAFLRKIRFPKLKSLIILHSFDESMDLDLIARNTDLNLEQLKTFFVGNYKPWKNNDFDLILKRCSNVENLGIGFICLGDSTPFEKFDYRKNMEKFFKCSSSLKAIYFIIFFDGFKGGKWFRTYKKIDTEIKESQEGYRLFDQIKSSIFFNVEN